MKQDPVHAEEWSQGLAANYIGLGDAVVSANRLRPAAGYQHTALEDYRQALPLYEKLHADYPDHIPNILLLKKPARASPRNSARLVRRNTMRRNLGSPPFSTAARSRSAKRSCAPIQPNTSIKRGLADELMAMSYLLAMSREDLPDASSNCQRALQLTESLASFDPANAEARQDLSSAHFVAGRVCQARGDLDGAAKHYRQSLAILEPLVLEHPDNVETAFDLERVRQGLREMSPAASSALSKLDLSEACKP